MLSIIIPVYDSSLWLGELIGSLQRQTCGDYEVVFINDGSTDDSQRILERYCREDSRCRCFEQRHLGVATARNEGLKRIRGEYFTFVDSDDILAADAVGEWLRLCLDNRLDCLFEQRITTFSDKEPTDCDSGNSASSGLLSLLSREEAQRRFLTGAWKGFVCGKAYRTECFRHLHFHAELNLWEDLLFFVEALGCGARWGFSTGGHYYYRQRSGSLSHRPLTPETMRNVLYVSCKTLEAMRNCGLPHEEIQMAWENNFLRFYHHSIPQIYAMCDEAQRLLIDGQLQMAAELIQAKALAFSPDFFIRYLKGHGYRSWLRARRMANRLYCMTIKKYWTAREGEFDEAESIGHGNAERRPSVAF